MYLMMSFFLMLFVSIYVYWCSNLFPYHMMVVSFNSKTTGSTSGADTADPSRVPEFIPGFEWDSYCSNCWFSMWYFIYLLFVSFFAWRVVCPSSISCFWLLFGNFSYFTEYLCHKWLRICSLYSNHNKAVSSLWLTAGKIAELALNNNHSLIPFILCHVK